MRFDLIRFDIVHIQQIGHQPKHFTRAGMNHFRIFARIHRHIRHIADGLGHALNGGQRIFQIMCGNSEKFIFFLIQTQQFFIAAQ